MASKGAAMGFLDAIEEQLPKKGTGSAVGFLDFVDEDEAALLEEERREEAEWIEHAVAKLTVSEGALENLVTCMQPTKANWEFYGNALLVHFQAHDTTAALMRFWAESEVRNTPKAGIIFREDSIRVQGLAQYMMDLIRPWMHLHLYRPVLRRLISSVASNPTRVNTMGLAESAALAIAHAMNEHVVSLPSDLIKVLSIVAKAVSDRFAALSGEDAACNFFFLHVVTPMIVNPMAAKLTSEDVHDREVLLMLARVGKTVQKWVNSYSEENELLFISGSQSTDNLADIVGSVSVENLASLMSPGRSLSSSLTPSATSSEEPNHARVLSPGEMEVLKFAQMVFKTDGEPLAQSPPTQLDILDARNILTGVLKKNYKMLRELETGMDRSQVLARHMGGRRAKFFSHFSGMDSGTGNDLLRSIRLFEVNEKYLTEGSQVEAFVSGIFSSFNHSVTNTYQMNGERHVFFGAEAWTHFGSIRHVEQHADLYHRLIYAVMHALGALNEQQFRLNPDEKKHESWLQDLFSLFPFLALTGRGRVSLGVNSLIRRNREFLLNVRVEKSADAEGEVNKRAPECRCFALLGFMGGWCSAAIGRRVHGVELQCLGKGDKVCSFVLSEERTLDSNAKKAMVELKMKTPPPVWYQLWDQEVPSGQKTPTKRGSKILVRAESAVKSLDDVLEVVRGIYKETTSHSLLSPHRARPSSLFRRNPSGMKKQRDSNEKGPSLQRMPSEQWKNLQPEMLPFQGEISIGTHRFSLFRANDFSRDMVSATHTLAMHAFVVCRHCKSNMKVKNGRCLSCDTAVEPSSPGPAALKVVHGVASSLLYTIGLSGGESLAQLYAENLMSKSFHQRLDILAEAFTTLGWGNFTYSPFSFDSGPDCNLICHVENSFECESRLGSANDLGSPTCSTVAGALAGFLSTVCEQRSVCVECECAGCGTSRTPNTCSFVCTVPSQIRSRVCFYLAAVGKEAYVDDLLGGLGIDVFSDDSRALLRGSPSLAVTSALSSSNSSLPLAN